MPVEHALLGFVAARCSTAGMAVSAIASGSIVRHFFASTAARSHISDGFRIHSRAGGYLCSRPPSDVSPFVHRNTDCQHERPSCLSFG